MHAAINQGAIQCSRCDYSRAILTWRENQSHISKGQYKTAKCQMILISEWMDPGSDQESLLASDNG